MRYQIDHDGSEVQAETQLVNNIEGVLKGLFQQYSWLISHFQKEGAKYQIGLENPIINKKINLNVYVGKIRNEARNDREMKIQLNGLDPKVIEKGRTNIILGIYCKNQDDSLNDLIFAGWSIDPNTNYTSNPSLRGISTSVIQEAKIYGFAKKVNRGTSVCVFRPEFIFYYIQNLDIHNNLSFGISENSQQNISWEIETNLISKKIANLPYQKIFFGAPGSGKSHKVSELLDDNEIPGPMIRRVTFHPEFDYNCFVGGYKPISEEDEYGKSVIKYKFIPQIFTNIYVDAWNDPTNYYYLIIEEINRGNCAEIFGDLFQLLDRKEKYAISPSNELMVYLNENLINESGLKDGKMNLPPNLYIIATMNTSDQSLFPMDSAFKRRWEWEYIPISYEEFIDKNNPNPSYEFIVKIDENKRFGWIDFIKSVNENIKNNPSLGMDKCIGNYFAQPSTNGSKDIDIEQFINKVVFYLWNDVFKDEENEIFPPGVSYEDFFPIYNEEKGGLKYLKIILDNLKVNHTL